MQSTKHLGMAVATIAGFIAALPSPAQQRPMRTAPALYFGLSGTGRADMNLFTVSGMIRF
jgi:anthranilate phosphoribosyltransferase